MPFVQALRVADRCAGASNYNVAFAESELFQSFLFNRAMWHSSPINVIRHDVSNAKKFGADDFLVGTCRVAVINGLAKFSHQPENSREDLFVPARRFQKLCRRHI